MNNVKISVVTVCYNAVKELERTMLSVLNQTYDNVEYIVIDGGSTDGTVEIIKKYADRLAYWVSEPDKGIYDAMNKGIKVATGVWINFMNAGDLIYANNSLESFLSLYDGKSDIVYGNALYLYKYCSFIPKFPPNFKMEKSMPMCHQSTFIKLKYHKTHLFDTSYKSSGDYNFLYHACFYDQLSFQAIPLIISIYDATEGMSKKNFSLSMRENLRIWNKQENYYIRLVQELRILLFNIKMQIKHRILTEHKKKYYEIRRLKKEGKIIFMNNENKVRNEK